MSWLVIGIGNPLRRDDGIGPWLAERVAAWNLPGVATRSVHQLTPELASEVALHDGVLFLDAAVDGGNRTPVPIPPSCRHTLGHVYCPGELMALAEMVGSPRPAWMVAIPATDLGVGQGLSAVATAAGEAALVEIDVWLREARRCMKSA